MSLETPAALAALTELSRRYGADPDYVIAGGGNSSWKNADALYVKASGTSMALAEPGAFVRMDRGKLRELWTTPYPAESEAREAAVLAAMMAARAPGEEAKRPSVETLLHDLLPFAFVMHTHPALVNGVTCARNGEEAVKRLFADDALWVPPTFPGYILAQAVRKALEGYRARTGRAAPPLLFLENHGIFVGADTPEGIRAAYHRVMAAIDGKITERPAPDTPAGTAPPGTEEAVAQALADAVSTLGGPSGAWFVRYNGSALVMPFLKDRTTFKPVARPFTPDHVVYAGTDPMYEAAFDLLDEGVETHALRTGRFPRVVGARGVGVFGVGRTENGARNALALFLDACRIAVYAKSFGGPRGLPAEQVIFIGAWEVEVYREKMSG